MKYFLLITNYICIIIHVNSKYEKIFHLILNHIEYCEIITILGLLYSERVLGHGSIFFENP